MNYRKLNLIFISCFFIFLISKSSFSKNIEFEINGNEYTDSDVILSLLSDIPKNLDEEYSNDIINTLNASNLFSNVTVNLKDNKYIITIEEFPNINKIYFNNNERLDDDELDLIVSEINLTNTNLTLINLFINETKKIYQSFGYNNLNIEYSEVKKEETNTVDLFFDFD